MSTSTEFEKFVTELLKMYVTRKKEKDAMKKLYILTIPVTLVKIPKILKFFLTFCNISKYPDNSWHAWQYGHHEKERYLLIESKLKLYQLKSKSLYMKKV